MRIACRARRHDVFNYCRPAKRHVLGVVSEKGVVRRPAGPGAQALLDDCCANRRLYGVYSSTTGGGGTIGKEVSWPSWSTGDAGARIVGTRYREAGAVVRVLQTMGDSLRKRLGIGQNCFTAFREWQICFRQSGTFAAPAAPSRILYLAE